MQQSTRKPQHSPTTRRTIRHSRQPVHSRKPLRPMAPPATASPFPPTPGQTRQSRQLQPIRQARSKARRACRQHIATGRLPQPTPQIPGTAGRPPPPPQHSRLRQRPTRIPPPILSEKGNRNRYNGSRQHGYDAEYGRGRPHDGHSRHGDDDSRKSNSIRSRPGSRRTPPRRAVRPHGDPLPGRVARRLRGTPSGQRPLDRRAADPLYRTLHRAAHGAEQPLLGRHVPRHPALRHPALRHG